MTKHPTGGGVEDIIAALRAPSWHDDSQWRDPKATYATKPRPLLDAAADALAAEGNYIQIGWLLSKDGSIPSFHALDTNLPTRPGWTVQPCYGRAAAPASPADGGGGVKLLESLKLGFSGPHGGGWWHVHEKTLDKLVHAALASRPAVEEKLVEMMREVYATLQRDNRYPLSLQPRIRAALKAHGASA